MSYSICFTFQYKNNRTLTVGSHDPKNTCQIDREHLTRMYHQYVKPDEAKFKPIAFISYQGGMKRPYPTKSVIDRLCSLCV